MIGFEHRDSVPGSDRSTNCAEYFANNQNKPFLNILKVSIKSIQVFAAAAVEKSDGRRS